MTVIIILSYHGTAAQIPHIQVPKYHDRNFSGKINIKEGNCVYFILWM